MPNYFVRYDEVLEFGIEVYADSPEDAIEKVKNLAGEIPRHDSLTEEFTNFRIGE